jgi:hypothetical protein
MVFSGTGQMKNSSMNRLCVCGGENEKVCGRDSLQSVSQEQLSGGLTAKNRVEANQVEESVVLTEHGVGRPS